MTSDRRSISTLVENTNAVKREYTALEPAGVLPTQWRHQGRRQLHALEALRQRQRREHPQRTAHVLDSAAAGVLRSGVEFPGGRSRGRSAAPRTALGQRRSAGTRTDWPALARHPRADPVRDAVRRGRHHPHPAVRGRIPATSSRRTPSTTSSPIARRVPHGDHDPNGHRRSTTRTGCPGTRRGEIFANFHVLNLFNQFQLFDSVGHRRSTPPCSPRQTTRRGSSRSIRSRRRPFRARTGTTATGSERRSRLTPTPCRGRSGFPWA